MAIREIRMFDDPILRKPTIPVVEINGGILSIIQDMIETMYAMPAFGVAANQIGHSYSMFVFDTAWDYETKTNKNPKVLINPEILSEENLVDFNEGCLSIPGAYINNQRFNSIKVSYINTKGETINETFEGLAAFAIQHECEHLSGKLFTDRLGPVKRDLVMRRCRKYLKNKDR